MNWEPLESFIDYYELLEKFNTKIALRFMSANGFDFASRSNDLPYREIFKYSKLLDRNQEFPPLDNGCAFRNSRNDLKCIVYQHNFDIHPEIGEDIKSIKKNLSLCLSPRGLKVEIYDKSYSWYSPGETYLVIISKFESNIMVPA